MRQTIMDEAVVVKSYDNFDHPELVECWGDVIARGDSDVIFMTLPWQRTWWNVYGRGRLILLAAYRNDSPVAIAPLFADGGMVFFVGSGGSDYLDFVGDVSDVSVLDALLQRARSLAHDFVGFRFYLVPDDSRTGALLRAAAERLCLDIYDEGELPAPYLDLRDEDAATRAVNKESLRRRERYFEGAGVLEV